MVITTCLIQYCCIFHLTITYSFTHTLINQDNKFCSPLTYQHFNDLNYCPNPQCNNSIKGIICLISNDDTNIINKYDWAVKSHCDSIFANYALISNHHSNPKLLFTTITIDIINLTTIVSTLYLTMI